MAAGVSILPVNVPALRARLNEAAKRTLHPDQLRRSIRLDDEIPLADLTMERVVELGRLQQTGMGNPQVQLCARGLAHQRPLQRMGSEKQHVKMWVTDGDTTLEAVWWGAGSGALPVGRFDLAFAPRINEYNGKVSVQLNVLDWRPEGSV
jgi:single-stranded-DNA-specific exonuclease